MFYNISEKIKTAAKVFTILGIVCSIIYGILLWIETNFLVGILLMIIGGVCSWVGSFMMYGFGELIECAQRIARNTRPSVNTSALLQSASAAQKITPKAPVLSTEKIHCPDCRQEISANEQKCPYCGCEVQKYK